MNLTYEKDDRTSPLETFEWDSVWWEHTEVTDKPRVLYIGDSISYGILWPLNRTFAGEVLVDAFSTSKALDNPAFRPSLALFGKQAVRKDMLLFNNGLHGWHLSTDDYEKQYEEMIRFLIAEFSDTRVTLLTTTATQEEKRRNLVLERNERVKKLAEKYGLPVIDLFALASGLAQKGDGVHFTSESYEALACALAEKIKERL